MFHGTHISPTVFPFIVIWVLILFRFFVLYFLAIPKFTLKYKFRSFSKSQKNIMKYKQYRQPTRCSNNDLLIIPVSSTFFGKLFCPSSGTLYCVLQLVVQCTTILPAGHRPATSWVHYTTSCNTQSSAPEDGRNHRPKKLS